MLKFQTFTECCGAGFDLGAKVFNSYPARTPEQTVQDKILAFVLTDVEVSGATEVCPGIWLVCNGQKFSEHHYYPVSYNENDNSPCYMSQNTRKLDNKVVIVHGFTGWELGGRFKVIKKRTDSLKTHPKFAILAARQHTYCENILLDLGWAVVSRRISPRTGSPLTLFYKTPEK